MGGELQAGQAALFGILAAAFVLLVTEWVRVDVVAVLIIIALAITGLLTPAEALAGFGSEPAIIVAAVFVLSGAIHKTGLSETIGGWIGRLARSGYTRAVTVIMLAVAVVSAFTHHLTTTALMLPVTLQIAREREIPASKLLLPLSFAASLGTTMTIIGAPAFLIARGVLSGAGEPGLGIFSITPIGVALVAAGTGFMVLAGRFLLPTRKGEGEEPGRRFRLENFFTELKVLEESELTGRTIGQIEEERPGLRIVGWLRGGRPVRSRDGGLRPGDVLLAHTSPDEMVAIRAESGVELQPIEAYPEGSRDGKEDADRPQDRFAQAVLAPDSPLVGHTPAQLDLRRRYGTLVVGIWRRDGWLDQRQELANMRLRAGDVLALYGDEDALARAAQDGQAFLMLAPFQGELRPRRRAWLAAAIMLATIALAASGLLSVAIALVAGAMAMVLFRCITVPQAYQSIDTRIYVFIAGAVPLGSAMEKSGAADTMAGWLQQVVSGWSQPAILLVLFGISGLLTQLMSDAATTALLAPVAASLAGALGMSPQSFVLTVAIAAVISFYTPIGHHGNLLVYGPGGYRFLDFVRVGTPLTVVLGLLVAFLAPLLWPG